jgi:hypothetical protein
MSYFDAARLLSAAAIPSGDLVKKRQDLLRDRFAIGVLFVTPFLPKFALSICMPPLIYTPVLSCFPTLYRCALFSWRQGTNERPRRPHAHQDRGGHDADGVQPTVELHRQVEADRVPTSLLRSSRLTTVSRSQTKDSIF